MNLRFSLLSILLIPFLIQANAQQPTARLLEKVSKKGSEIVIPYEKYQLPNGLTVILHEDHSDPLVHVDVTYHVGSAREEIGKSGFAHFFEHMMFQGSDHVADEEHFKAVTESGGTLNGSTSRDRTNYFETVPANQLEKMLWLEADRMGFLLDAVTQQKFEVQRSTVKNERGQNYDNRPYGLMSEYVSKNLYDYGHPYSWLTIGYIEDLNKVDVNDLKNFFLRWYGPNNAALTIGGDIDIKQTLAWVEKYFGSIPRGKEVTKTQLPMPVLKEDRYISYTDNYAKLPILNITYPDVPSLNKDEPALDILAGIIGQGNNSILYKNLVKTRKAVQASMNNPTSELSGELTIMVVPYPDQSLSDIQKVVKESLLEFEKNGVSDEDLARFKGQAEAQSINTLSSVSGKVSTLAFFQYLSGNPNQISAELNKIRSVTKEDVMRVYNQYVKNKPAVILSILTKGKEMQPAAPDNYTVNTSNYKSPDYGYKGLVYNKAHDSFDRSKKPGSGANPTIKVPPFWKSQMTNGIKIIGTDNNEIPTVSMSFSIEGGGLLAVYDTAKAGLPNLVARMMNEDTQNYTAEKFSAELQKLGSTISVYASDDEISVEVTSLTKNVNATMKLLEEKLFHPKFTAEAFERVKKQITENLRNAKTQPERVASDVFYRVLYGETNVRSYGTLGLERTVANISLDDVQKFYDQYFSPSVTSVVVVGDMKETDVKKELAFLDKWPAKAVKVPLPDKGKTIDKTVLYFVNVPKAAQSQIRVGYLTDLTYDATGTYYRLGLANYILGGAFNSRINLNLREAKGWTYGARSGFSSGKYTGEFIASAGVRSNASDSSVVEFVKEITNYAGKGILADELDFTKVSIGQSDARRYETNMQKAVFLSRILKYNLPATFVDEQNKILKEMDAAELNKLSNQYLDIHKMDILVVGDKDSVMPGLQKLGYPIVELDTDGKVL
jgi:zinc protease